MKNIRIFYLKNCHFLVVKFSVYLNRRVFVMRSSSKQNITYKAYCNVYLLCTHWNSDCQDPSTKEMKGDKIVQLGSNDISRVERKTSVSQMVVFPQT